MPRPKSFVPKYRRPSSRDVAFVVIHGKRHYLPGKFGSEESKLAYSKAITKAQNIKPAPTAHINAIKEHVWITEGFESGDSQIQLEGGFMGERLGTSRESLSRFMAACSQADRRKPAPAKSHKKKTLDSRRTPDGRKPNTRHLSRKGTSS